VASKSALLHSDIIMQCHVTLHDLSSLWRDYQIFDDDEIKAKARVVPYTAVLLH
jgi:hypothetical protein